MDFNRLVKSIVEPTLASFGLILKEEIKGVVKYQHINVSITFSYHYNFSYEVNASFTFNGNRLSFEYDELLEYFSNYTQSSYAIQIVDEEVMTKWLVEVNRFLKENLNSLISGSKEIEVQLEKIKRRRIDEYNSNIKNRLLSEEVGQYWSLKDYDGLVKFLNNNTDEIKGINKKKYEYALKMLKVK